MITQNPLTGRAKKKLGNTYARTLYGKNVIQTCPIFGKVNTTPQLQANRAAFNAVNRFSQEFTAQELNRLYYAKPANTNRRMALNKHLQTIFPNSVNGRYFNVEALQRLGSNGKKIDSFYNAYFTTSEQRLKKYNLPQFSGALLDELPLLVALCESSKTLVNLSRCAYIDDDTIVLNNIPETLLKTPVSLLCLWQFCPEATNPAARAFASYQKQLFK